MQTIQGTSNRILEIDLSRKAVDEFMVSEDVRRLYLGGKGLGLKLLSERLEPEIDPLGEDNYLAFMPGVMMGTGGPCSGRFAALTKSPLTGIMVSSTCGGPFGMALKTAGLDGLLIRGKAASPIVLVIDENSIRFENAAGLWGLDTRETLEKLDGGPGSGVLAIGPAGENQVPLANIVSGHRFLGRGGMGAVMGSKNLKAIAVSGRRYKIVPADQQQFTKLKQKALQYLNRNAVTANWYRNFGTAANVNLCNAGQILPINNFTRGSHSSAANVSGQAMEAKYHSKPRTCIPCHILCGHMGQFPEGPRQIPEYETVGLLGTNLGLFDPDVISDLNEICNRLGMDTVSAGGVLAYAMEAGQKGLLDTDLRFGRPQGVAQTLLDMANRRGLGADLARGTRWLAERYGGADFAMQVKGLELPAYDPRGAWGQGLAYAVSNRGGCHLSAYVVAMEVYFNLLDPHSTDAKPEFTCFLENLKNGIDSMVSCYFTLYAYTLETALIRYTPKPLLAAVMQHLPGIAVQLIDFSIYPQFYSAVTGLRMSKSDFLTAGERIQVLERWMNSLEGIDRKDDCLPTRLTEEARADDPENRTVPLEPMLEKYYGLRGYDEQGLPKFATLKRLGIKTG